MLAAKLGQNNNIPTHPTNNPPPNIMPGNPTGGNPVVTNPVVTNPVVTNPVVTNPVVTNPVVTNSVVANPVVPPQVAVLPAAPVVNRYKVSIILSKGDRFKKQMALVIEEMRKPNDDFSLEATEPELEDTGTRCSVDFYIKSYGNEDSITNSVGILLNPYKVKRDRIIVKPM